MNVIGFRASCPFQLGHWDLAGMNSVDDLRVDGTGAALLNLRSGTKQSAENASHMIDYLTIHISITMSCIWTIKFFFA